MTMGDSYALSSLYGALRSKPFPTAYDELRTPVTADVLEAGLILAFCTIAFCFFLVLPGTRGKERVNLLIRVVFSLFVGTFILLCNFGQEWEYSKIKATTSYRAFSHQELKADIEVKIGLRSVNITLRNETIYTVNEGDQVDYNERFEWAWDQGRQGFGPQAGHFNREFRAAQVRGTPLPILWIAEYFTFDGEGIRFGRNYRTAGWYTHILLWTAFPLWVLSNVVMQMVLWYGGCLLLFTGGCLLAGAVVYASVRNFIPLEIPFYYEDELVVLRTHYGWCFWINLVNGLLCTVAGLVVLFMDLRFPEAIATFFGIDILQDYEEIYTDISEFKPVRKDEDVSAARPPAIAVSFAEPEGSEGGQPTYGELGAPALRKRAPYSRFRRSSIRKPFPAPRKATASPPQQDDLPIYANYDTSAQPFARHDPIGEEDEQRSGSSEDILLKTIRQ